MKAAERLYITADRTKLVAEGDPEGAFLYAAPGDDIPESAVELFGLIDGRAGAAASLIVLDPLLRVATIGVGELTVAGFTFHPEWHEIADGQIDEAQLLAILVEQLLAVEVQLEGEAGDWVAFPGRDEVAARLKAHVDYDLLHTRAHDRVTARKVDFIPHPTDAAWSAAEEARRADETNDAIFGDDHARRSAEEVATADAANRPSTTTAPVDGAVPLGPTAQAAITGTANPAPGAPVVTATPSQVVVKESEVTDPVVPAAAPAPAKEAKSARTKEAKPGANKEAAPPANKSTGD